MCELAKKKLNRLSKISIEITNERMNWEINQIEQNY